MPSSCDAFMELQDPDVWGETYDAQFGEEQGRNWGAFEISHFKFDVAGPEKEEESGKAGDAHSGKKASKHKQTNVGTFTISKYIDKGSADLFLSCCRKKKIQWAIISIRETGEQNRQPFLVLEFQRLKVTSFEWDLNPGDAEAAAAMETVTFDFETILIKYARQDRTGHHGPVKMRGFDMGDTEADVTPLPFNQASLP